MQEIFANYANIARFAKIPAREYYLTKEEVFSFQRNFTEWKSDNSKPCKWPFKVCMSIGRKSLVLLVVGKNWLIPRLKAWLLVTNSNEQTNQSTIICLGYWDNGYCYVWRDDMSQIQLKAIAHARTNFPNIPASQTPSLDRLHSICLQAHTGPQQIIMMG